MTLAPWLRKVTAFETGSPLIRRSDGKLLLCSTCPCDPCKMCTYWPTVKAQVTSTVKVRSATWDDETEEYPLLCTYNHTTTPVDLARQIDSAWAGTPPTCVYTNAANGYDFAAANDSDYVNASPDPSDASTWDPVIEPFPGVYLSVLLRMLCHDPPTTLDSTYPNICEAGAYDLTLFSQHWMDEATERTSNSQGIIPSAPFTGWGYQIGGAGTYTPLYLSLVATNVDLLYVLFDPTIGEWEISPMCGAVDQGDIASVTADINVIIYQP